MTDENNERINRWLDAALKQYGNAEPRMGLEGRVLARLRSEQERPEHRRLWWWPLVAATAAALLAGGLFLDRREPMPLELPSTVPAAPGLARTTPAALPRPARTGPRTRVGVVEPRREQFPSPAPLTEQEQILTRYVREHYEHAVLVARAQADQARRDRLEDARSKNSGFTNSNESER